MGTFSFGDFLADAVHTVSGYLRRRPDPACESALRAAFAELDAELAAILGHRAGPHLLSASGPQPRLAGWPTSRSAPFIAQQPPVHDAPVPSDA